MIFLISIATFCSTLAGGFFALHLKDRLHLILGFSAGAVIGVSFFDLMPEALELTRGTVASTSIPSIIALGFVCYLILDRLILFHTHGHDDVSGRRGVFGAGSLSFHSFLDGVGIGLAFHASPTVGAIVAIAVLTHDFSDGINTVSMILRGGGSRKQALRWLTIDAVAPVLGVASTFFFSVSDPTLGLFLALFAGFFLYIGASDLLPESHHAHPVRWTTIMTVIGVLVLYLVVRLTAL